MDLNQTWFLLLGVLLIGYAVLDGFDLGVGIMHLFAKTDEERRTMMNSIGPVWDGNEVWLVTGGGALFAAFPHAYATSFSGLYLAFWLVLVALIFRAVAMEFRSKEQMKWWRQLWDVIFFTGSTLAALLFGVAIGNLILGIPVGADMEYKGGFFNLLSPFALLTGVFTISTLAMHGSLYIHMKSEGELHQRARGWAGRTFGIFAVLYVLTTAAIILWKPAMLKNFGVFPALWVIAILNVLAIANIPRALSGGKAFQAFLSSSVAIAALLLLLGIGLYPNLIISSLNPDWNLTIYNAASSQKTLGIMLLIALIGMPLVIAYTIFIYRVFRGKVKLDKFSY